MSNDNLVEFAYSRYLDEHPSKHGDETFRVDFTLGYEAAMKRSDETFDLVAPSDASEGYIAGWTFALDDLGINDLTDK